MTILEKIANPDDHLIKCMVSIRCTRCNGFN